jgi:hypothetical protein
MGRRSRANAIQDPEPIDEGEPGTFHFGIPVLTEIASKKAPPPSTMTIHTTAPSVLITIDGNCRLRSSHDIRGYVPPQGLEYPIGRYPNKVDADAYVAMWRVQGFGPGAIVTRRYQPIEQYSRLWKWGFISFARQYSPSGPFEPFFVRWFDDKDNGESAWAEDLVLIHAAIDYPMLRDILEQQDVQLPEDEKRRDL